MKKTKIICTLGPSTFGYDEIKNMALSGMDTVRYNFSHADKKIVIDTNKKIDKVRNEIKKNIGILYDTKGPEFRCGMVKNDEVELISGNVIKIVKEDSLCDDKKISVNHPDSLSHIRVKDIILVNDGLIKLEVIKKTKDDLTCKILTGGILKSKKSISVPGRNLKIPFINDEDKEDILFAINNDADFIALSFVSTKEDVLKVRDILKENDSNVLLISKIESKMGVDNLKDIVSVSDGVMVARGDLGVEVPMEDLPFIQKRIINECRKKGKIAIVATEMLESMTYNSRPTRAEISDVSNAVLNETDAVMLSAETSIGKYPVQTVKTMSDICKSAEDYLNYDVDFKHVKKDIKNAISSSVVETANVVSAKLIIAATMSGRTARVISNLRGKCPVLATCTDEKVARSLALSFGVYPRVTNVYDTTDEIVNDAIRNAKKFMKLKKDDYIIITGAFPKNSPTNFMKIEKI